jgi:hypothetical protein
MFEHMYSRVRKIRILFSVDDGRMIKNMVLALGSYTLCVLSNKLFLLVIELLEQKAQTAHQLAEPVLPAWIERFWLLLLPVSAMLLELLLFIWHVRFGRVLFAVFCFALIYHIAGALYTGEENNDGWIYLQTAIAWTAAIGGYMLGPAASRQLSKELKQRSWIYFCIAVLGLLRQAGYF